MGNFLGSAGLLSRDVKKAADKLRVERDDVVPYLPDDIVVTNIVTRVPADDALRCRCVCRAWRDLTSTREFVDMHLISRQAPNSILVEIPIDQYPESKLLFHKRYLIDSWWGPTEKRRRPWIFDKFFDCSFVFSLGGLIVLEHPQLLEWIILNPVNGESVTIKFLGEAMDTWEQYYIHGVFFHPVLKEYCTLWGPIEHLSYVNQPTLAKFKLLVMGSTPYSRDIGDALPGKYRAHSTHPILVNDHLYWMAWSKDSRFDIIEFDLKSEEFVVIPSPVQRDGGIDILNNDGLVSVVKISLKMKLVTVWTLEDREGKLWTSSSYSISTQGCKFRGGWGGCCPEPIALAKGELVFSYGFSIFMCNLNSTPTICRQDVNFEGQRFFSHVMTLASLRNCRSHIEARETTEETNGFRVEILWEQSNRARAQKSSVSDVDRDLHATT